MEILTLLKANLKKKKSTFISIAVLMVIVTSAMTAILSATNNYRIGLEKAYEISGIGDTSIIIGADRLTDELKEKVENSSLVKKVDYYNIMAVYGADSESNHDQNSYFLQKLRGGIELFEENLKSFSENIPPLQKGEMYVPLGLKDKLYCNVGDTLTFNTIGGDYNFKIAGFVQEPSFGAQTIGWKHIFISDEDFDILYKEWKPLEENDIFDFFLLSVHKADDCDMSGNKFQRQLNLETKIADYAQSCLTAEQSWRYSTLMPDIITNLFTVFVVFLFIIVLILISHSISTEIESDYVTFGILKSQGFSDSRLIKLFFAQYLPAQLIGIAFGVIISVPLEAAITDGCQLITGVMPNRGLSLLTSLAFIVVIMAVSSALIFVKTRALGKVSPVKAINGGKEDIYFDSRIKLPIGKRFLSLSLAVRQFTSAKRRYIGTIAISAILVFFMLTVNLIIELMTSSKAISAMGVEYTEIAVYFNRDCPEEYFDEVEELVRSVAGIKQRYKSGNLYLSMDGESLLAHIVEDAEKLAPILKGRAPVYENETVITEMVADTLEIGVGDEVTVSFGDKDAKYIVSGIYQSTSDSGMCFAMSEQALKRIYDGFRILNLAYELEDSTKTEDVKNAINEKYKDGGNVSVETYNIDSYMGVGVIDVMELLRQVIYVFSAVFALVAVKMVCTRAFLQERKDIGIYKAVGFTSNRLRISFGLRFLAVSAVGVAVGVIISLLFSAKVLGIGLSLIGLSHLPAQFDFVSVAVPAVMLVVCFFAFAYWASGKIKRVEVRELVVE